MKKTISISLLLIAFTGCINASSNKINTFDYKTDLGQNIHYTILENTQDQIISFNKNKLKNEYGYQDITIITCDKIIRNLAGKINYGYGALCEAKEKDKQIKIKVCENQAFAYKIEKLESNETVTLESLARFTSNYCYGG